MDQNVTLNYEHNVLYFDMIFFFTHKQFIHFPTSLDSCSGFIKSSKYSERLMTLRLTMYTLDALLSRFKQCDTTYLAFFVSKQFDIIHQGVRIMFHTHNICLKTFVHTAWVTAPVNIYFFFKYRPIYLENYMHKPKIQIIHRTVT